ncbi:hypothetical protein ACFLW1_03635, partial [Chloroflexota bacterium]
MGKIREELARMGRRYWLPLVVFGILLVMVVYPTITVLVKSLSIEGEAGLGNFIRFFTQPHLFRILWQSVLVAGGVAAGATLLGLVLALVVFKTVLPLRKTFSAAAVLPIIIPGFVATLAYIFLFGR